MMVCLLKYTSHNLLTDHYRLKVTSANMRHKLIARFWIHLHSTCASELTYSGVSLEKVTLIIMQVNFLITFFTLQLQITSILINPNYL